MQCQDNSKLRIPLPSQCDTTDIGCVPITNGMPDCPPQPDELPLAFDPNTVTLWMFSCKTREWINFTKFHMCQLGALNLENVKNICEVLNIGVNYDPGTGCEQGTITLGELAEQLILCLKLETKVLQLTPEGDKLKIWIEGLPTLPPFYIKGTNIWTEGGTGTESDPLHVVTYDPICKWPEKTQEDVDVADKKRLGACVDGEMVQVPYPRTPCEFPQTTIERVNAARDKDFIVCVDGEDTKVPIINGVLTPVCASPHITAGEAKTNYRHLRIVGCDGDKSVLFPVPKEMFEGEYVCVPFVEGDPTYPPLEGTGPIRVDCNDNIWFWLCDEQRWHKVGYHDYPNIDQVKNRLGDICDLRFHGWGEGAGECARYTNFEIGAQQLIDLLKEECDWCCPTICVPSEAQTGGGWCIATRTSVAPAIWCSKTNLFIRGEGNTNAAPPTHDRWLKIEVTNNFKYPAYLEARLYGTVVRVYSGRDIGPMKVVYYLGPDPNFDYFSQTYISVPYLGTLSDENRYLFRMASLQANFTGTRGHVCDYYKLMQPGESITLYAYYWFVIYRLGVQWGHSYMTVHFKLHNYVVNCDYLVDAVDPDDAGNDDLGEFGGEGDDVPGGGLGN